MDFNIMADRSRAQAAVMLCKTSVSSHAASRTLLHAFEGEWVLDFDGAKTEMAEDSLALLRDESGKAYDVRGSGVLLRVDIELV
jgi:environmental stress-induced protein Ves